MIQELKNFIEHISEGNEEVFSRNLKLRPGIYVLLDIEQQGDEYVLINEKEIFETEEDLLVYDGKVEDSRISLFLDLCVNIKPVSPAKILNPNKKIYGMSCSPFALGFNKKNYSDPKHSKDTLLEEMVQYFKGASKYIGGNNQEKHFSWYQALKGFSLTKLDLFLSQLDGYTEAKPNTPIYLFIKSADLEDYIYTHQLYLSEKVFNKDKFNVELEKKVYGVSDSLSGFNDKKPFLQHHTAPLEYNYRVDGEVAMQVWRFFQLQSNKQIPNPIPIFIDDRELNGKMVSVFQADNTGKMGHSQLIKSLSTYSQQDLENYYLIYFDPRAKGSKVQDIDFVSQFRYKETEAKVIECFPLGGSQAKNKIETVFDLENNIFNRALNGQLVVKGWLKYFDEIDPSYTTHVIFNLLLKYRKAIYDFIYKSQRHSITSTMFDDMMTKSILDDIKHDVEENGKHSKEYPIKEKLNIWFSLYDFFINTTSKSRINMVNQTEELLKSLKELCAKDNEEHIQDDSIFAFAVGQLVYYLLNQSESSNRTHALLEPFLQKTDAGQLKQAIARTFATYKHAITFYRRKYAFDKLMSEVMGYEPDEKNMKNLLPMILAGYFSKSIMDKPREE